MRRPWFCLHRQWIATNSLIAHLPDESLSVTWTEMMCIRCGKMRRDNSLKPRESIVVPIETWIEEV